METYRGYTLEQENEKWVVFGKTGRRLFAADTAEKCLEQIDWQERAAFIAAWKHAQKLQ